MRWVARRFTPVCRSRCGARGADRGPGARTTPHPPTPPPSLLSVLRTGVWVRVRGVNSLAKHPERVGTGPKDKKRLQIQLTWQNRPSRDSPVPPLPGAREGRGSLELVEIFQMRPIAKRFTPVCRSRYGAGAAGRGAGAGGSVRVSGTHPLCAVLLVQANRTTRPIGVWDQQWSRCEARRCEAGRCEARRCKVRVRGVRFAWRSFPNGLYQKNAKIDLGVSLTGKIGEMPIILFRSSPPTCAHTLFFYYSRYVHEAR